VSKGVQIAGGATLIAFLLGWYGWSQLDSGASFAYYQDLHAFRASPAAQAGDHARVHGYVSLGSIERDVEGRRVRFLVQNDPPHSGAAAGEPLSVVYTSLETPDLFKDGAEVVVEGRLSDGAFHADKVMAKCPSKFSPEAEQGRPQGREAAAQRGTAERSPADWAAQRGTAERSPADWAAQRGAAERS
jgi:cytochrome c-type biogenesis protein CcmE